MRQLRLVGLAEDGASLVLESPTGESYRLPVDDRVRAACRGDLTRLGQIEIELDNPLRPREIQMRVRAGESAEQVAASSGMPLDRVLRFASAVLQERGRVVAQARGTAIRPPAADALGPLVEDRLVSRGTDPATLAWDAWRADEGGWVVRLAWRHGGERDRDYSATWSFDLARRALQPADPAAEQLSAEEFHARTITAVTPLAVAARAADEAATRPRPADAGRRLEEIPRRAAAEPVRTADAAPRGEGFRGDGLRGRPREEAPREEAPREEAPRDGDARDGRARDGRAREDGDRGDRGDGSRGAAEVGPDQDAASQGAAEPAVTVEDAPAPTRFDEIRAGGRRDRRAGRPPVERAGRADADGGDGDGGRPSLEDIRAGGPRSGARGDLRTGNVRPVPRPERRDDRPADPRTRPAGQASRSDDPRTRPAGQASRSDDPRTRPAGQASRSDGTPGPQGDRDDSHAARDSRDEVRAARPGPEGERADAGDDEPRQVAAAGGATIPGLVVGAGETRESDEDRARRATVPSWDDILLGVRRRH